MERVLLRCSGPGEILVGGIGKSGGKYMVMVMVAL